MELGWEPRISLPVSQRALTAKLLSQSRQPQTSLRGERTQSLKASAILLSITGGKWLSRRPVSLKLRDIVLLFLGAYLGVVYSEMFAGFKATSHTALEYVGAHIVSMVFGFIILVLILKIFQRLGWVTVPREL